MVYIAVRQHNPAQVVGRHAGFTNLPQHTRQTTGRAGVDKHRLGLYDKILVAEAGCLQAVNAGPVFHAPLPPPSSAVMYSMVYQAENTGVKELRVWECAYTFRPARAVPFRYMPVRRFASSTCRGNRSATS